MLKNPKHVVLFFTQDVSLQTWDETGLFDREVQPYLILARERGWNMTFVTYGGNTDLKFARDLAPIRICPLWKNAPPKTRLQKTLYAPLALLRHKAALQDAAVYKTNQFWGGWNALLARYLWDGRVIARQGYEYLAFAKAQKKPPYQVFIARALEWLLYRFADRIVLATPQDADFARMAFPFLKNRDIDIQPNWIDMARFFPRPDSPETEADLVYIGRLSPQKNLSALVRATALTGASLDLYGEGELRGELETLARMQNADIRFRGRVPNDEIPELLSRYKAFVLPSLFEGNPKALLEAMACGKAVIASDIDAHRALICDRENGLLCPANENGLADAIGDIMHDPALRKALGEEARRSVERTHSLAVFLDAEEKRYG